MKLASEDQVKEATSSAYWGVFKGFSVGIFGSTLLLSAAHYGGVQWVRKLNAPARVFICAASSLLGAVIQGEREMKKYSVAHWPQPAWLKEPIKESK